MLKGGAKMCKVCGCMAKKKSEKGGKNKKRNIKNGNSF